LSVKLEENEENQQHKERKSKTKIRLSEEREREREDSNPKGRNNKRDHKTESTCNRAEELRTDLSNQVEGKWLIVVKTNVVVKTQSILWKDETNVTPKLKGVCQFNTSTVQI
jgi:hypothetical protein